MEWGRSLKSKDDIHRLIWAFEKLLGMENGMFI